MANPDLVLGFKFPCSGRDIVLNLVPQWRCSLNIVQVAPRSGTKVYLLRKLCFLGLTCHHFWWKTPLVDEIAPNEWFDAASFWFITNFNPIVFWVVATQMFFIFIPIWGGFPFWLIFFKWVETTNQFFFLKWPTLILHFQIRFFEVENASLNESHRGHFDRCWYVHICIFNYIHIYIYYVSDMNIQYVVIAVFFLWHTGYHRWRGARSAHAAYPPCSLVGRK